MSDRSLTGQVLAEAQNNNYTGIVLPDKYKQTAHPFRPVKCLEDDIKNKITPTNNFLYFTTDSKKIYYGQDNKFLPMCANSGIFYGKKDIYYENNGFDPDPNVDFLFPGEIEGTDLPEVDDLILNTDGCFYRVVAFSGDSVINTKRLTLRGSGGGGGSVGGDSSIPAYGFYIKSSSLVYASETAEFPFTFGTRYTSDVENAIQRIEFYRGKTEDDTIEDNPFYVIEGDNVQYEMEKEHTLDLIDCKKYFSNVKSAYTIKVYDVFDTMHEKAFTVQIVSLSIDYAEQKLLYSIGDSFYSYDFKINGAESEKRRLVYEFFKEDDLNNVIFTKTEEIKSTDGDELTKEFDLSALSHGVYILKVQAFADLETSSNPIPSNILWHKIAYFDESINTPLLMVSVADEQTQYVDIPLEYRIVYPSSDRKYTLEIIINNNVLKSMELAGNVSGNYNLYFEAEGLYSLKCYVNGLNISYEQVLDVKKYDGILPVISRDNLMLYLNPRGKSNDEITRNTWVSNDKEGYIATLQDFHYGTFDGWLTNDKGAPYLRLASGAKLTLPSFKPFIKDPTIPDNLDSRMGNGITIEIDFEISGVLDYDDELIKCISYDSQGVRQVGFAITGNQINVYNSRLNGHEENASLLKQTIVEKRRLRTSIVIERNEKNNESNFPMAYIYLDGILSNAIIYDKKIDSFRDSSFIPATLEINSEKAQIDIYSIRFYSTAFSHQKIINNYTASLDTLIEREKNYNDNNVFSGKKINYAAVANLDYDLQVPYMTITGGWKTILLDKWRLLEKNDADSAANNPGLPTGKKDYRLIDVEVKYPKTALFEGYEDYSFKNTFKTDAPMSQQHGQKPANGGAIMYAQGTSSMEYPVKNLRLRFKNEEDWYSVRPDIADVEIICMKADYMESSGSHNTGTANFVDSLYSQANMATPGQKHFNPGNSDDEDTIVTCIKGHPCLIFYRPSEDDDYEYVGKYNLNLDKATPEPFGFNHDDSDFGYLSPGDEYYKVTYYDEEKPSEPSFIGQVKPTKGGDYYPDQIEELAVVQEGEKINSIHCFEFLDNAIEVCNFMNKAKGYKRDENGKIEKDEEGMPIPEGGHYSYYETWYNTFTNSDGKNVPGWTLGFESRYPEDRVGYHDADMLYPLASWINELYSIKMGINDYAEEGPNPALANARFKNEYKCYLDQKFTLAYYIITEALLMADNRVKNMMIATWGKEANFYFPLKQENGKWIEDKTQEPIQTNFYKMYPIFYDMDTMLGLDNTGHFRFNYYDEDTQATIYNGKEILWNFVRDTLDNELTLFFNENESSLHEDTILGYLSTTQADLPNQAFYNGDADVKYLGPAVKGYHDDLYDKYIAPGAAPYLYAAQGNRSTTRDYWLSNRMKYLRGKRASSKFHSGDRIEFRWYYPSSSDGERIANSVAAVPPNGDFYFSSLQTGYAGVSLGANSGDNEIIFKFDGEVTNQKLTLSSAENANGTEAYILGLSNLTSVGDLSNKYLQKFVIASQDVRLKELILGNGHKDYYNPYWGVTAEGASPKIDLSLATYLRYFNLLNCSEYKQSLDFSKSSGIERILLTGSGVNGITLPESGILQELRLPAQINTLTIKSHPYLTKFSMGDYDYEAAQSDIITSEAFYRNDFSKIKEISIENTPIDTHEIVKQGLIEQYNLPDINWIISEDYSVNFYNSDKIEQTVSMIELDGQGRQKIVCIPALEKLKYATPIGTSKADSLAGTITIDIPGAIVDEYAIYSRYVDEFPNLIINYGENIGGITSAYTINFYSQSEDEYGSDLIPYQSFKHNGTLTWNDIIVKFTPPEKKSTDMHDFVFTGVWKEPGTETSYDMNDPEVLNATLPNQTVLNLVPIYDSVIHLYSIIFHDDDGKVLTDLMHGEEAILLSSNSKESIKERLAGTYPLYFNYKEYTGAEPHYRYTLKGWISKLDYDNKNPSPEIYDLDNTYVINKDLKLYAYYVLEDAKKVPTNLECFEISRNSGESTYQISIKEMYRHYLRGKITLPAKYNGQNITIVEDFNRMQYVTHIYFEPNSSYLYIKGFNNRLYNGVNDEPYVGDPSLEAVYLPSTVISLNEQAFKYQFNLKEVNFDSLNNLENIGSNCFAGQPQRHMQIRASKLPSTLKTLGVSSFYYGGSNITFNVLPNSLERIPSWCFAGCPKISISVFGTDTDGIGLAVIDASAFYHSTSSPSTNSISEIWIKQSVHTLLRTQTMEIFKGYGENVTAHLARPSSEYITSKVPGSGDEYQILDAAYLGVAKISPPNTYSQEEG